MRGPFRRYLRNRLVFDKVFDGSAYSCPGVSSNLNHRVDVAELDTCLVDGKAPVNLHLVGVSCLIPSLNFTAKVIDRADSARQALAAQGTQLVLGDVQPTSMLRGVMDFESFGHSPGFCWWKCFVERPQSMS